MMGRRPPEDEGTFGMLPTPVMRDDFRRRLRSHLMVEAAVVYAPERRRMPFFFVLRPALAAALVTIVAMAGATSAAGASLPGDLAFPLKRAAEDLRVALTFDDVARVRMLSELADRRVEELAEIAREHPAAAPTATTEVAGAVDRFVAAVKELSEDRNDDKRAEAEAVADAARDKRGLVLASLKPKLPASAQQALQRVIEKEKERSAPTARPGRDGDQRATSTPQATRDGDKQATASPARSTATPAGASAGASTATPRATETQRPTETPRATDTPHPTDTPQPTDTPRPTETPRPSDSH